IPRVANYLGRTQMGTGGAPPRSQIRDILLQENKDRNGPKDYEPTKTEIRRREAILAKWINRHDITAVFSPQCSKTMSILPSTLGPHICTPCRLVPKIKSFQNALHREEGTIKPKCTPHEYQNPLLGGVYLKHNDIAELVKKVRRFGNEMFLEFAKRASKGRYEGMKVLTGLIETAMVVEDRQNRGKGLQNMHYPIETDQFMITLALTSTRAYNLIQQELGGRTLRSVKYIFLTYLFDQ
ncbi:hypothetical protein BT96DRAFT_842584, partial [Gymnopus androsaceus JB14]